MIGYKGFNGDFTCDGFQYEVGKTYTTSEKIGLRGHGFHFCRKIVDCFNHNRQSDMRFAKVKALGEVITGAGGIICVTDKIRILEEIPGSKAVEMTNVGYGNTGYGNTGISNTGNRNSGDGNRGDNNTGDHNVGKGNSGWENHGDFNVGENNYGSRNTGGGNTGDQNSGSLNSGGWNSGDHNRGDANSGHWNLGNRNSGSGNLGDRNSGESNSGNLNSGNRNRGDRNSGDWNLSSGNNGCFMTDEPTIMMFNKPTAWTLMDWRRSRACSVLFKCPEDRDEEWVSEEDMTEDEMDEYPDYETEGGYLKFVNPAIEKQAWWDGLSPDDRQAVMTLPNFDADIFFKITGIRV